MRQVSTTDTKYQACLSSVILMLQVVDNANGNSVPRDVQASSRATTPTPDPRLPAGPVVAASVHRNGRRKRRPSPQCPWRLRGKVRNYRRPMLDTKRQRTYE